MKSLLGDSETRLIGRVATVDGNALFETFGMNVFNGALTFAWYNNRILRSGETLVADLTADFLVVLIINRLLISDIRNRRIWL